MKRITEQMVKSNYKMFKDEQKKREFLEQWCDGIREHEDELTDYIITQIEGALYLKGITDSERIAIIRTLVDWLATIIYTPKAWNLEQDKIIEYINGNYRIEKIRKYKKENNGLKKIIETTLEPKE